VRFKSFVLITAVLTATSAYITLYTLQAHTIAAAYIIEDPNSKALAWRSAPSGSLFPWPTGSGMLEMLSSVNGIDTLIHRYLIKTWILLGSSAILWSVTSLSVLRAIRTWQHTKNQTKHAPR
jgi:hypothetical protein